MISECSRARVLGAAAWLVLSAAAGVHAQWDPETPMTATGSDVWGDGIAATGSTVHLIYGTSDLNYRRSSDEGGSWTAAVPIGTGTLHLTDPIVADGNDVWVVYLDDIQLKNDWCCQRDLGSIWLLRSRDGGTNWDSPVQLSASNTAYRISIAYAANRLHLVWMDFRSGAWDTYYLRSPDRGDTWEPEVVIAASSGPFGAERPQVAARGDSVHVTIWDDRDANPSCMPGTYLFPQCPDVFHVRSLDGGRNWESIANVAKGGAGFAGRNDIAVTGSMGVIINYNVDLPGETGSKLFAVASSDDGATWAEPIRLTTSANASDHGSIIGAGDAAYLVWHDDRDTSNREIYFRQTTDRGASWDPEEHVSSGAAGDSSTPLDSVTPGFAHVVWIDNRSGSYQVYYRRRALDGAPSTIVDAGASDAGGAAGNGGLSVEAGTRSDADDPANRGPDAAATIADSGVSEGALRTDGGRSSVSDASALPSVRRDASHAQADNGSGSPGDSSAGCGCRVSRRRAPTPLHATIVLTLLLARLRTRRARRMRVDSCRSARA